jgi:hypothetical protein
MTTSVDLVAVLVGSALMGLWLAVRLERLTPRSGRTAACCLALAWLVPGLAMPILHFALAHLPPGLAVLSSVFPIFVATFALTALGLRYLVELAGSATR